MYAVASRRTLKSMNKPWMDSLELSNLPNPTKTTTMNNSQPFINASLRTERRSFGNSVTRRVE